jgi:hypothetical protein
MSATHSLNSTASFAPVLYVAFELSSGQWKLATTTTRDRKDTHRSPMRLDRHRRCRTEFSNEFEALHPHAGAWVSSAV